MPFFLNICGDVDSVSRIATITYTTLDTLTLDLPEDPMAGYMPAITSAGDEISWISYTIDPVKEATEETEFTNKAWIEFDNTYAWEDAPHGNPTTSLYDLSSPSSEVLGLPTTVNADSVLVQWQGNDPGCGLITYIIYASINGSGFKPWLTTSNSEAWFKGEFGNTYSFYSIAKDGVGNTEAIKVSAEATTKLVEFEVVATISQKWSDLLICNNTDNKFVNYQWFKNDVAIPGATQQFYQETVGLYGRYYVKVTTTDGKIGVSNVIEVGGSTKSVKVYPNPSDENQEYTIEVKAEELELLSGEMILTNVNGQIISRRKQLQPIMKLDGMVRGVYLVKVQFANGESFNEKLIVK
jgi:hypothetical protein